MILRYRIYKKRPPFRVVAPGHMSISEEGSVFNLPHRHDILRRWEFRVTDHGEVVTYQIRGRLVGGGAAQVFLRKVLDFLHHHADAAHRHAVIRIQLRFDST